MCVPEKCKYCFNLPRAKIVNQTSTETNHFFCLCKKYLKEACSRPCASSYIIKDHPSSSSSNKTFKKLKIKKLLYKSKTKQSKNSKN